MSVQGLDYHAKGFGKPEKFDISGILSKTATADGDLPVTRNFKCLPSGCCDHHQLCRSGASRGDCGTNPIWMGENCQLSCDTCNRGETGEEDKATDATGQPESLLSENVNAKFTDTPQSESTTEQEDHKERELEGTHGSGIHPEHENDMHLAENKLAALASLQHADEPEGVPEGKQPPSGESASDADSGTPTTEDEHEQTKQDPSPEPPEAHETAADDKADTEGEGAPVTVDEHGGVEQDSTEEPLEDPQPREQVSDADDGTPITENEREETPEASETAADNEVDPEGEGAPITVDERGGIEQDSTDEPLEEPSGEDASDADNGAPISEDEHEQTEQDPSKESPEASETAANDEADPEGDGTSITGDESDGIEQDSTEEPSEEPNDEGTPDNDDSSDPESDADNSGMEPSDVEAETDNDDNEGSGDDQNEASDESTEEPLSSRK